MGSWPSKEYEVRLYGTNALISNRRCNTLETKTLKLTAGPSKCEASLKCKGIKQTNKQGNKIPVRDLKLLVEGN